MWQKWKMERGPHLYLQLPFILLSMLGLHISVEANYLYLSCQYENGNYSSNNTFETNLKNLLGLLPHDTAERGFYNTTVGEGLDRIYGQALCRGDASPIACESCVWNSGQEIMKLCIAEDALIWYELCQVRYSVRDFFSGLVYMGKYPDSNDQEKRASDPTRFYAYLMYLMKNISGEAAYGNSTQMFATGQIKYSVSQTIYGLVQCTRDMSGTDCDRCLVSALGDLTACCSTREGGTVVSGTCSVKYELSHFFTDPTTSVLSYPASAGNPASAGDKWKKGMTGLAVGIVGLLIAVLAGFCAIYFNRKKAKQDLERSPHALLHDLINPVKVEIAEDGNLVSSEELPCMDLATLKTATDDFSSSNKLGQGGFGTVYKGVLSDGKEVAVKRLSGKSSQGLEEFKNEVILIAKLQHRNLVRLLGCGIEGDEKLLVYEFMPNKSLDNYIFDSDKHARLDWRTYISIIDGIASGLVYLHEDSRLRIIHRDLKPSNVLLDHEMVAKISDFGMARIFCENQSSANTRRVVGTYGYMAPEYAMGGLFSVKSDVFSFGVILLEIISGKRNSGFYLTEHAQTLLAYAWKLWTEGRVLELLDPSLAESGSRAEIFRCIHIGLLCVQEGPGDRPTMSEVVTLLGGQTGTPPEPKKPAFSVGRAVQELDQSSATNLSVNQMTVSSISPR